MDPVVTERLIIRRPLATDLDDVLTYRNHPCLVAGFGGPMAVEEAVRLLEAQAVLQPAENGGWVMWAVERRRLGRIIGEVGLFLSPGSGQADLGWSVHPDQQQTGVATEAGRVLLAWAFGGLELHRVTAECGQHNVASWRPVERLGMLREGAFRQSRRSPDEWQDKFLYALLGDEWRRAAGATIPAGP